MDKTFFNSLNAELAKNSIEKLGMVIKMASGCIIDVPWESENEGRGSSDHLTDAFSEIYKREV